MKILEEFIKKHISKSKSKKRNYRYNQRSKQKRKERDKIKYIKNKEKIKKTSRDWYHNNKDKRKVVNREWCENNFNKIKIAHWKYQGVKSDNYDLLYEKWKNTKNCEKCNVELTDGSKGNTKRCLDHSHSTGEFRNILCNTCNIRRGETNI